MPITFAARRFAALRLRAARFAGLAATALAALLITLPVQSQEGHPIKGTWLGQWKGNKTHGDDMFMVLTWDGQKITGTINPGTDNITITKADLNPEGWKLTIEADGKDKEGAAVRYTIEGAIQNLELPNRSLVGTWKNGSGNGEFEASRQ